MPDINVYPSEVIIPLLRQVKRAPLIGAILAYVSNFVSGHINILKKDQRILYKIW